MFEWHETVQKMIVWIEQNIDNSSPLQSLSQFTGFSPYYCSSQFHLVTGKTLREYISARRVSKAAIDIRDTKERIIDIAFKYGFSSQEAFTRSFTKKFGVTPKKYRTSPVPIPLVIVQEVFSPSHYSKINMPKNSGYEKKIVEIKLETIPKHKFIGVWDLSAKNYYDFFKNVNNNCDEICGVIESMTRLTLKNQLTHTAGWFFNNEKKGYFYGIPVTYDYSCEIPKGMSCKQIPELKYITFFHPPFNYLKHNKSVMQNVENIAWSFNFDSIGYKWDKTQQIYQKHYPEEYGYSISIPVKVSRNAHSLKF